MDRPGAKFRYDPSSPSQQRADALALNDAHLLTNLVRLRDERGMSQSDVAAKLGISLADVRDFERAGADPRMSLVRRYAHAVEAHVDHTVNVDGRTEDFTAWRQDDLAEVHRVLDEVGAPQYAQATSRILALSQGHTVQPVDPEHEMHIGQEER